MRKSQPFRKRSANDNNRMMRFAVWNKHGLRFHLFARDRAHACSEICKILGKRSVPLYLNVAPA